MKLSSKSVFLLITTVNNGVVVVSPSHIVYFNRNSIAFLKRAELILQL